MSDMVLASKGYVDCLPRTYWEATVYKKTMSLPIPLPYISSLEFNLYCNSPIKGVIKLTDWVFPQIATTEDDVYLYFVNFNNQPAKGDIVNPQYITKNSFKKGIHKNVVIPFDNAFIGHDYFEPKCGPEEGHTGWVSINDGRPMAIGQVKKEIIDGEEVYTYIGPVAASGTILIPTINLTEPVEKTSTSQQRHENAITL